MPRRERECVLVAVTQAWINLYRYVVFPLLFSFLSNKDRRFDVFEIESLFVFQNLLNLAKLI
jgi:hypothetical protein